MCWSEIDLPGKVWHLSKARTKSNRAHSVPLNGPALETLAACPRTNPDHVFALSGEKGYQGWSAAKRRLDARSGVAGWHLHDLRRTAATGMQAAGVTLPVISGVLNHSLRALAGVTAVYCRDPQFDEKRAR